ncbi:hypothetical protein K438DRAFT_183556 [Mycena galopus ATCC 62051]|nr:hypothetical protein K438DRAFT_183556 [Mycena galopus ATCC 62051]
MVTVDDVMYKSVQAIVPPWLSLGYCALLHTMCKIECRYNRKYNMTFETYEREIFDNAEINFEAGSSGALGLSASSNSLSSSSSPYPSQFFTSSASSSTSSPPSSFPSSPSPSESRPPVLSPSLSASTSGTVVSRAIAGSAVGGTIAVLLAFLTGCYLRRRRGSSLEEGSRVDLTSDPPQYSETTGLLDIIAPDSNTPRSSVVSTPRVIAYPRSPLILRSEPLPRENQRASQILHLFPSDQEPD